MNPLFDGYALFVGTDFFVDYWQLLAGREFSNEAVAVIQSAGRSTVRDFMEGESTYWEIDFSPERRQRSDRLFSKVVAAAPEPDRLSEEVMRRNFCEDEKEQRNVAFAVGFLYRIANDREFCVDSGVGYDDAEVVAASLPSSDDHALDIYQLERAWLASTSEWDVWIRSLTPDLPAYTLDNFNNAYSKTVLLPTFVANLSELLPADAKARMLARLNASMERQFPANASLAVPLVMRTAPN